MVLLRPTEPDVGVARSKDVSEGLFICTNFVEDFLEEPLLILLYPLKVLSPERLAETF
jgi:hypothetical protein